MQYFHLSVMFLAILVGAHAFWVGLPALGSISLLGAAIIAVGYFMKDKGANHDHL